VSVAAPIPLDAPDWADEARPLGAEFLGAEAFALLRRTLRLDGALALTGRTVERPSPSCLRLRATLRGPGWMRHGGEAVDDEEDDEAAETEAAPQAVVELIVAEEAGRRVFVLALAPGEGAVPALADACLLALGAEADAFSALAFRPLIVFASQDNPAGPAPDGWPDGVALERGLNVPIASAALDASLQPILTALIGGGAFAGTAEPWPAGARAVVRAVPVRPRAPWSTPPEGTSAAGGEEDGDAETPPQGEAAEPEEALELVLAPPAAMASGAFSGLGLSATLDGIALATPLSDAAAGGFEARLRLILGAGGAALPLEASCDPANGVALLRLGAQPTLNEGLAAFAEAFGGGAVTILPGTDLGTALGGIALQDAWIAVDLTGEESDGPEAFAMGLAVGATAPIPLFDGRLHFAPQAALRVDHPFDGDRRRVSGVLHGEATLGPASAAATVTLPDGAFAAGFSVQLSEAAAALGVAAEAIPEAIAALTATAAVEGEPEAGVFSARLSLSETASWAPERAAGALTLHNLLIAVSREGTEADVTLALAASATVGDVSFAVEAGYAGGWSLSGATTEDLPLERIARDLIGGAPTPEGTEGLTLTAVSLAADFREDGGYAVSGATAHAWKPFGDLPLELQLVQFALDKRWSSAVTVDVAARIDFGPVALSLEAHRPAGAAGWRFTGSLATELDLAALAGDIGRHFGADAAQGLPEGLTVTTLSLDVDTGTRDVAFVCAGSVPVAADKTLAVRFEIAAKRDESGKMTVRAGCRVDLDPVHFDGRLESKAEETLFAGTLALDAAGGRVALRPAVAALDERAAAFLPDAALDLRQVLLALRKPGTGDAVAVFDLLMGLDIALDLSDVLPIGDALGTPRIALEDLRVRIATGDLSAKELEALNALLGEGVEPIAAGTDEPAVAKGLDLSAHLSLGAGTPMALGLDAAPKPDKPAEGPGAGGAPAEAEGETVKWFEVGRSVGPLHVGRAGLAYDEGRLGLRLDSAVDLAGLHLGLKGFGLDFPLADPAHPAVSLGGLALAYDGGPVTIGGGFERIEQDGTVRFDGAVELATPALSVTGFGSFAGLGGAPSLFVFAAAHAELGGPPPFRVRGLAAGFGYNRTLTLPPIEAVATFPLVQAAMGDGPLGGSGGAGGLDEAMRLLAPHVAPRRDCYWLAAGVRFSSFEMVESVALLSASFGDDIEIGLLGLSRLTLPKGASEDAVVAFAELALRVSFKPGAGLLAVEGRLTEASFLLSRDCRLTGGFAFFLWFAGEHEGDFVVSLGGYHPRFEPPAHYPAVPRLGIDWKVSEELRITAEMYFALTPACMMVGGRLAATYHGGCVRAAFVAYADFLILWEPLKYSAEMGIALAVSADLELFTLHFELTVDLALWGPAFGGRFEVHVAAISFAVAFGAPRTPPAPLDAAGFRKAFLPDPGAVVSLRAAGGTIGEETGGDSPAPVLRAHGLRLEAQSVVPLTGLRFGGEHRPDVVPTDAVRLGIAPMAQETLDAVLEIDLVNLDAPPGAPHAATATNIELKPIAAEAPAALWQPTREVAIPTRPPRAEEMTLRAPLGVAIRFLPHAPEDPLPKMRLGVFAYRDLARGLPDFPVDAHCEGAKGRLDDIATVAAPVRAAVLGAVAAQSPFALAPVDLSRLAEHHEAHFQSRPIVAALGARNEGHQS
jgi:hypothetical protein